MPDGDRFSTPDQLRSADSEVAPAPAREIGRLAARRSVPAFHRQDAEAIADADAVDVDRLCQRRQRGIRKFVVELERDATSFEVGAKRGRCFQRCHSGV